MAYGTLCVSAILFLSGSRAQGGGQQQATWTGRLLRHAGGQIAVGLIGAVVVVAGLGMLVEAALRRFERQLDVRAVPDRVRPVVVALGLAGSAARALIVVLAGALIIDAAITVNPQQSTGLDGALRCWPTPPSGRCCSASWRRDSPPSGSMRPRPLAGSGIDQHNLDVQAGRYVPARLLFQRL